MTNKPESPPEYQTEAEKLAYSYGWWKALEVHARKDVDFSRCDSNAEPESDLLTIAYMDGHHKGKKDAQFQGDHRELISELKYH